MIIDISHEKQKKKDLNITYVWYTKDNYPILAIEQKGWCHIIGQLGIYEKHFTI